jgi:hypothetical protein
MTNLAERSVASSSNCDGASSIFGLTFNSAVLSNQLFVADGRDFSAQESSFLQGPQRLQVILRISLLEEKTK